MFADRTDAGRRLADRLREEDVTADVVVGVTRGGVPVARVVADELDLPLGTTVVQKIGAPDREELAVGAVAADGTAWINDDIVAELGLDDDALAERREAAAATAGEKADRYRGDRAEPSLSEQGVLVVDDGMATGATARVAVASARRRGAERVVLAVPVAAASAVADLGAVADEVIALATPEPFGAVGRFYDRFEQVDDGDVRATLERSGAGSDG